MSKRRALLIALGGVTLVAGSAMYALACDPGFLNYKITIHSVTIDGVEQTDLT